MGIIFTLVGTGLTLGVVTAFVGIPFLVIGIIFFGLGTAGLVWRYGMARRIVNVLRMGQAAAGQIAEVRQNYSVEVNGRHPWVIRYQFRVIGQEFEGNVSTLNPLGQDVQAGKEVWVLYLPEDPKLNSMYPHP